MALAQFFAPAYLSLPGGKRRFPKTCGAVAQLGERVNGIHEVSGSIPLGSTTAMCHGIIDVGFEHLGLAPG